MHRHSKAGGGFAVAAALACAALVPTLTAQAPASPPAAPRAAAARTDKPYTARKTEHGAPDLSGLWNAATLTPLERPANAATASMTEAEALRLEQQNAQNRDRRNRPSAGDREAPPVGGDGSTGASGNVGGYNNFWVDPGDNVVVINGERRTSIIIDPPNGRMPARVGRGAGGGRGALAGGRGGAGRGAPNTPAAPQAPTSDAPENFLSQARGAYDNMEQRPLAERCLMAFSSSGGPPALPALYNNFKQIVQTKDHVVILNEMVHDVRVVRLNSTHIPQDQRKWLGDSIGWYEGDSLVVETTNFTDKTRYAGSTPNLKITERFRRLNDRTLLYRFTIDDPNAWATPWTGEYTWVSGDADDQLHEYACHEGNHSFGGIMRGARLLEKEAEDIAKQK